MNHDHSESQWHAMNQRPTPTYVICGRILNIKSQYFNYLDFGEQMSDQNFQIFNLLKDNKILGLQFDEWCINFDDDIVDFEGDDLEPINRLDLMFVPCSKKTHSNGYVFAKINMSMNSLWPNMLCFLGIWIAFRWSKFIVGKDSHSNCWYGKCIHPPSKAWM